ncbi:MAG TPA: ABC transporter permease, partial [Vicinamibacterales bacterium]|nr:ABC transporter permease [Vicinamibacterales bacterium]
MLLDTIAQDLRQALRAFRRSPGFTAVAVLTLSLGIGATTAIFSIVNAVLLKPLPYVDADRLVVARLSLPDYKDLRTSVDAFDRTAVWATNLYNLRTGSETQQALGGVVSPELPGLLGAVPVLGRSFVPDDERADVVILGYGLWQSRFGGDPSIVGRTVDLSGTPYTVVGVAPSWFRFPTSEFQLWTGLGTLDRTARPQAENRGLRIFSALARLKEGVSIDQARAQVAAQSEALARAYPETNADVTIAIEPLADRLVGGARAGLRVLLATVALVLFIACANVANLMLARTATRERELAIRTALGAARGRIVRQVLTESVVLALAGGALGLLLAAWGVDALPSLLAGRLPRAEGIALDTTVLLFALAASVLTALLFGIFPALHAAGGRAEALKERGRGIAGTARGRRLRHTIAVAEIALAVTVVVGAGLLVRSFLNLTGRDPGFTAANLLSFNVQFVALPDAAARTAAAAQVLERVASVPGVTSVGASTGFPPVTAQRGTRFEVEGRTLMPDESGALFIAATPGYFTTIGAPVTAGREIARTDAASTPA